MQGSRAIPCPRAEQLFEVSARNGKLMVPVVHLLPPPCPRGLYRRRTGGTILLCTGICGEPSLRDKINTVVRFFFACPIFLGTSFLMFFFPRPPSFFTLLLLSFSHNFFFSSLHWKFLPPRAFSFLFPPSNFLSLHHSLHFFSRSLLIVTTFEIFTISLFLPSFFFFFVIFFDFLCILLRFSSLFFPILFFFL